MFSPKSSLIAITIVILVAASGCRRVSTPTPPNTETASSDSQRQHPDGGALPVAQTKFFKGSIGNAHDLQMKLVREGDKLTGTYFYQKVGTKIDLRGTVDKDGKVALEEFDKSGQQTGVFSGLWGVTSDGEVEISGSWNKPGSDKKTAFSLHQEPIEFSTAAEITTRQIRENNKKLKYEVDVRYPQLSGSSDPNFEKFNQTVRGSMAKKVADFKREMAPAPDEAPPAEEQISRADESMGSDMTIGYEVTLARDDLISIAFTESSYSAGAAHPNSYTEVINFDLKNGKQLKLGDLFLAGSKYLGTLSKLSIEDLKKQSKSDKAEGMLDGDWIQKGAAPDATNYESWNITRKGLALTFDPYQVAPYAAGAQHVVIPYSALKDIIKPDGPLGVFVK